MGSELITQAQISNMANIMAASGLFGIKSPAQAQALMLLAQAEGRHPATVVQDYHIIQNRPALKADAILSRFLKAGGKVEWIEYAETVVKARWTHEEGGSVIVEWNMDMAKRAGLIGKDNWKNYPRAMLRSRVISEGVRTVYPSVLCGMYTPEEMDDANLREQVSLSTILTDSTQELNTEETEEKRRMKYLRGKLNQSLLPLKTKDEIVEMCKPFQREQGKNIWEKFTGHNDIETFRGLVDEHIGRVQSNEELDLQLVEIESQWVRDINTCADKETFQVLEATFGEYPILYNNATHIDELRGKGRELGFVYKEDV